MNALRRLSARWRRLACKTSVLSRRERLICADELDALAQVIEPMEKALRRNVFAPDMNQSCDHAEDDCPLCEGRAALAALDGKEDANGAKV